MNYLLIVLFMFHVLLSCSICSLFNLPYWLFNRYSFVAYFTYLLFVWCLCSIYDYS